MLNQGQHWGTAAVDEEDPYDDMIRRAAYGTAPEDGVPEPPPHLQVLGMSSRYRSLDGTPRSGGGRCQASRSPFPSPPRSRRTFPMRSGTAAGVESRTGAGGSRHSISRRLELR